MKKSIRFSIGFLIAMVCLYLIFENISLAEIRSEFGKANLFYIALATTTFYIGYACRIQRWRLMLIQDNPSLSWSSCAGPLMASVAANNILPLRAGDLLRAFAFNNRLGINATTSLTTLVVERLLDLLMLIAFLGLALAYFGMDSSRIIGVGGAVLLVAGFIILLVLIYPFFFKSLALSLSRVIARCIPKVGRVLLNEIDKVFSSLDHISHKNTMVKLIFWSVLSWGFEGLVFWFVALSLPAITNDIAAWLALPVGTLATLIPSTPGYVGTFDYFTSRAMSVLGNSNIASAAFVFIVHAVLWLPASLAGGLYLALNHLKSK